MSTKERKSSPIPDINLDLFNYLRETYAGPLNANVWPDWLSDPIRVDDYNGDVVGLFCTISITVSETTPKQFELSLENSPSSSAVLQLIKDRKSKVTDNKKTLRADARVTVSTANVTYPRKLAKAYRQTVSRRACYIDANWAWICRRTANSLDRLADNIWQFRKDRRHG